VEVKEKMLKEDVSNDIKMNDATAEIVVEGELGGFTILGEARHRQMKNVSSRRNFIVSYS